MSITLQSLYNDLKAALPPENAQQEARLILETCADIEWSDLITNPAKPVPAAQADMAKAMAQQRSTGKPLSRIIGQREFWGLPFVLNEGTLDPRPDTETLVRHALAFGQTLNAPTILDMGTGTGCIIIALLHELKSAQGIATDIDDNALKAARQNAQHNGVNDRLRILKSNWFDSIPPQQFDIITSNPPYIDPAIIPNLSPEVKNHDPVLALDGGENGLAPYEIIFSHIKNFLKPTGRAFLEIGYDQCGYIARIAEKYRIRIEATHPDLAGILRVVEISCGDK